MFKNMKVVKIFIIGISFFLFSCKQENKTENNIASEKVNSAIEITKKDLKQELVLNKTFFRVTKTDSVDLLYHYCNASINTIKVYKDSIWEDFGQEDYTMLVDKIDVSKNKISFTGKQQQVTPEKLYVFEIEDESMGYWKINNKTYIDNVEIGKIKQYKEPDSECF